MKYMALVKSLDPQIEEEVTIEIQGYEFTGFAFICPYKIEVGKKYPVLLGFVILNELIIKETHDDRMELERIGEGFQYYIRGVLQQDMINTGIKIFDEDEYFVKYPELIGKHVEMRVDRITVEFLRE